MAKSQTYYAPSGDPIRCYTFDNVSGTTVYDEMGNGNATLNDTSRNAIAAGGKIGNCFTPIGEGNYYEALGIADISTWRSISVWALFPVVGTKVYDFGNTTSGPFLSRFADNTIRHQNSSSVLATVSDSDYHHYVLVFASGSDTNYRLYIDGVEVASRSNGFRIALACLGGNVNAVNYLSPRMDVVQIYDFELSADDVAALYNMETPATTLVAVSEQLYGNAPVYLSALEQPYGDTPVFRALLSQPYSLRLLAQLLQEYGNAPAFRRLCHQYYGSANLLRRLCNQDYGDYLRLRAIASELWAYPAALRQVAEQRYSIAGERLAALMAEGYDISDKALLRAMLDQLYVLPPGESLEQRPVVAVRAGGVTLSSVYHISLEMDEGQAGIVGELHLADEAEFLLCRHLETLVEVEIDATTYVVLAETPRRSDPELGRTEYYVGLVSKKELLETARPLTRTFDGAMASAIAAEMAALGGVTLSWQLVDWYIPPATLYANNETPLSIIRRLSETVGGILQSLPDGTLVCRPEYILDTTAWNTATPDCYLTDGDNFFSVDSDPDPRNGWNVFLLADRETASGITMTMTPIDISATTKEIRITRVPWDSADVGLDTSGGLWVEIVEEGVAEEEASDLVEIIAGEGRTTKPFYGLVASDYQEDDLGAFTVTEDGLVTTAIAENSLLRLTYTTRFYRFTASDAQIEDVQFFPEVRA